MTSTSTVTAASVVEQLDNAPDVLTWLNTVLDVPVNTTPNDPPLVAHAATLDALQAATSIAAQSTSAALEHIIDDIARAAPRLAYDIHFTRDGALALRSALAQSLPLSQSRSSAHDSAAPDATAKVLERLQHLDTLRVRMEAARDVLREAESWSALETEVTALLAEKAYARAASRLSASARLMPVAARTTTAPGTSSGGVHEPRRALLTSLANQLEAALSPDLVRAVTASDVESCKSFYAIFVDIEREGEFRNYYYGTRRSSIVEAWSKAVLEGESGSSDSATLQSLNSFYPSFLSSFFTLLNGERTALPNIFPDPEHTLAALIFTSLSALTPPPAQRLAALFHNGSTAAALKDVVKLFQASEEFARGAERILDKLRASAPPLLHASSSSSLGEGKHSRRRSIRMSMSWRSMNSTGRLGGGGIGSSTTAGSSTGEGAEWDQCLFQPFLDFQVDFGTLERRLLDETLGSPLPDNITDLDGDRAARAMRERVVDVFSAAEESIERCLLFTHGYACVGLVHALDAFISTFVETWTNSISNLVGTDSLSVPGSNPTASGTLDDEELADLDYTSQDWAQIQKALHLLAAGRAVKDRLGMFEARLTASLRQVSTAFRMAWGNGESGVYTPGVTKGQGLLLAQSTLNSLELRALLTRVAPSSEPAPNLLPSAHASLTAFARANQRTLQRVLLSPLYAHLAAYPALPLWSAARVQDAVPGMAGVVVPTFSLSPSDVAHRVGDGLLNLPRLFEVYAEDDALGFELAGLAAGPTDGAETIGVQAEEQQVQVQSSPEAVTAAWLASLGRATVIHLTRDLLPQIRTLSAAGAAQLNADLGYLETIVRALGVGNGDLERWKALARMTDDEGRAMLASDDGGDAIAHTVAKMRKWVI